MIESEWKNVDINFKNKRLCISILEEMRTELVKKVRESKEPYPDYELVSDIGFINHLISQLENVSAGVKILKTKYGWNK